MAISYDGLYAGQPSGDAVRTARFVVPRATTPAGPLTVPWAARAVQVDNPSGSWYTVNGRWLRPWTISAVVALDVPSTQVTIAAVTPAGQLAEDVGEDLLVIVTEEQLAPAAGLYTPPVRSFTSQVAFAPLGAVHYGEVDAPATLLAPPAGIAYVVQRLAILPDLSYGLADHDPGLLANVQILWDLFPSAAFSWFQAVGPEFAYATDQMQDGALVVAAGDILRARAYIEDGFVMFDGGTAGLVAEVQYYAVTA